MIRFRWEPKLAKMVSTCLLVTSPQDQFSRCLLMHGLSGTGKTHSVANRYGFPVFVVLPDDLKSKWNGECGKVAKAVIKIVGKHQPAFIIFDECEGIIRSRESASTMHDTTLTAALLMAMQGDASSQPGVMIMCLTNLVRQIDPAAMTRFGSRIYCVLPPDASVRWVVWKNALADRGVTLPSDQLGQLAEFPLGNLRVVKDAMLEIECDGSTEEIGRLFDIVQNLSSEPDSDAELDTFPDHQRVPDLVTNARSNHPGVWSDLINS